LGKGFALTGGCSFGCPKESLINFLTIVNFWAVSSMCAERTDLWKPKDIGGKASVPKPPCALKYRGLLFFIRYILPSFAV